jgi:hypothetical protein
MDPVPDDDDDNDDDDNNNNNNSSLKETQSVLILNFGHHPSDET